LTHGSKREREAETAEMKEGREMGPSKRKMGQKDRKRERQKVVAHCIV